MPLIEDCKREILSMFNLGLQQNQPFLEISAGHLHRRVFAFGPGVMSLCCAAMRQQYEPSAGDSILCGVPDEVSAEFTIEYRLPRPGRVDLLQVD